MARTATTGTDDEASRRRLTWSADGLQHAYRDHSGAVYAAARGFCGPRAAGDVTVDVFLQLWRHPEQQVLSRVRLRTALLALTHDISAHHIRSASARRTSGAQAADAVVEFHDAERLRVVADERSLAALPLGVLSGDERDAIVTAYYGGFTYQQAAAALGLHEDTVKSRIRAGLQHLGVALARTSSSTPDAGVDHP